MTYELKNIFYNAYFNQQNGLKNVLATVVFLEGSSYRKPGVRMLICENGKMTGAVSGGCVENEVKARAQSVFETGEAKMMTYDGRYRLGCEGLLYILLEPILISDVLFKKFQDVMDHRESFKIDSVFEKANDVTGNFGSTIYFDDKSNFSLNNLNQLIEDQSAEIFTETLKPSFKLLIIGGEHDAVKLCSMAALLGWDVDVVTSLKDPKQLSDFPRAKSVSAQSPEIIDFDLDAETVVVLMTHNYAQDLKYLVKLEALQPKYIGVVGSVKRREHLLNELMDYLPDVSEDFLDKIHSPAGLNIGAITPEEIALSILAEILALKRNITSEQIGNLASNVN